MAKYQIDNAPYPIKWEGNDRIERTLQNAKNLLMCRMGETAYDRWRGFNPALYDLPIEEMQNELLPELDRIMLWEPDVEVADAEAKLTEDGETYIRVTIEVTYLE